MTPWQDAIPALEKILVRHFPNTDRERAIDLAKSLYDGACAAASVQWMERNDRRTEDDRTDLKKAADHIANAGKRIQAVGWHGGNAIRELAQRVHQIHHSHDRRAALGVQGSIEVVAEFLESLSTELQRCADYIDVDAPTVMSAFGDDRPAGRRAGRSSETVALFVSRESASVFRELSGSKPTVITDAHRIGHPAYGPFIDFLRDVFLALGVDASVPTWAKAVT